VTDQLEDLFADLRTDTLTRVRPPGVARVRRTVHRRRVVRSAATCVVAVAAVGAGVQVFGLPPSVRPAAPNATTLGQFQDRAALAIGGNPSGGADTALDYRGVVVGGTVATGRLIAATRYTLEVACVGRGQVAIVLHVGPAAEVTATALCANGGTVVQNFQVLVDTSVSVELQPAEGAEGHAAMAARIGLSRDDQLNMINAAKQRLPGRTGTEISMSDSFLPRALTNSETAMEAGEYRYVFACTGAGRVTVTVSVRNAGALVSTASATAYCGAGNGSADLPFVVHADDSLDSVFAPDAAAAGQAAFAARLELR
jgi:hypothetical protein